jgi:hypothetical protein
MQRQEKKRLREIKRQIKRSGTKRVRARSKRELAENREDADFSRIGFGDFRSEHFNGMDEDATRKSKGSRRRESD